MTDHIGEATKKVIDLDALEKLADEALLPMPDRRRRSWFNRQRQFSEAANPSTIKALIAELKDRCEAMWAAEVAAKDLQENGIDKLMDTFEGKGVDYAEMVAIRSCLSNIRAFLARNGKGEG
ncbi:hypothetical protein HNP47_000801 [Brevundimonas vesicularis]|uniref:Uncharacterized protein n=1 Tax=Brevundimonas vesicularis TaxID=41276 RepID=A0A7W9L4Z3_BREVE|nr:hypothetical protein [Brevundimonas vesicularis]MBB5770832.1 hypothetical protein [Brevundimonas vesicularis]